MSYFLVIYGSSLTVASLNKLKKHEKTILQLNKVPLATLNILVVKEFVYIIGIVRIIIGNEHLDYDQIILASHADQSLKMLEESTEEEKKILSKFFVMDDCHLGAFCAVSANRLCDSATETWLAVDNSLIGSFNFAFATFRTTIDCHFFRI